MQSNHSESIDFLKRWRPSGPWVLTAISVDRKGIETRTFRDIDLISPWLDAMGQDQRNIYFSVNPTIQDVSKKPMREDVKSMDWLHVDLDPRAGEDINQERARALKLLQEHNPPPTVIVFSGGGYQGFWRLMDPFDIEGQEDRYEHAKRYNQAIELSLGADTCHNVDRIMRLPGTVNYPDSRKRKKGREPSLASLVEWHQDRIYALDQFVPAPEVQTDKSGFSSARTVVVSGNIKRINDLAELPAQVNPLCRQVIAQGNDPDDPTRFPSRSEALFFVCCELVRGGVDDDTIYSILTDPDWAISSSVLDKGRGADAYAKRQIERAREDAVDPNLRKLNDKYAVVTIGNKMRVVYEDYDETLSRYRLVKLTFEDFRNRYMHMKVVVGSDAQGNPRYAQMGKWWLEHDQRRQYGKVVFAPGREVVGDYNMWRGFGVEARPGSGHESFLSHVRDNICSGDDKIFDYVVNWIARAVQQPGCPGETALVLRGNQGVGKGFLAKTIGKLFGRHYVHVSNAQHLTGNFNSHLRDCCFLFADEAFYAGDKRHASTLKTLVTEDTIMIEGKGVDSETCPNCLHIVMASNEDWVVPAGADERRFCVLDVASGHRQDTVYFGKIAEDLRQREGYSNLLHHLLCKDISAFNVRNMPKTKALMDQKLLSLDPIEEWWYGKLKDGLVLPEHDKWYTEVLVHALLHDYVSYTRSFNMAKRGSATRLGMFLHAMCPKLEKKQVHESAIVSQAYGSDMTISRPYVYVLPTLAEAREHWDQKFGGPYHWPAIQEENVQIPF